MRPRLGVNIEHIATIRELRGEFYPSLTEFGKIILDAGADQLTLHLRKDRFHIQDTDLGSMQILAKSYARPLHLELSTEEDVLDLALGLRPDVFSFVPSREDVLKNGRTLALSDEDIFNKLKIAIAKISVSAPDSKVIIETSVKDCERAVALAPYAVLIHTGEYADAFNRDNPITSIIEDFKRAKSLLDHAGIHCHAGHGLTLTNIRPLLMNKLFHEYTVGHFIISESLRSGMETVVANFITTFKELSE